MQKKIFITTMLCLTWASIFAQGVCGHPKAERQLMRFAEVEIDGFFCDSVMVEYPIYTDGEHGQPENLLDFVNILQEELRSRCQAIQAIRRHKTR